MFFFICEGFYYTKNLKKGKIPFCVNLDHWFRKEVIDDLLIIRATTNDVVNSSKLKKSEKQLRHT